MNLKKHLEGNPNSVNEVAERTIDWMTQGYQTNKQEVTAEEVSAKTKFDSFKKAQITIIEKLQKKLIDGLESNLNSEELHFLSKALQSNLEILDSAEEIYLDLLLSVALK